MKIHEITYAKNGKFYRILNGKMIYIDESFYYSAYSQLNFDYPKNCWISYKKIDFDDFFNVYCTNIEIIRSFLFDND